MNKKNIDLLNIFLLFISLFIAFKIPFELFLFSYAVLGPLHYLTEINWLKEKNYFVFKQKWIWIFVFASVIISLPLLIGVKVFKEQPVILSLIKTSQDLFARVILTVLLFAVGLVYLRKNSAIVLSFVVSIILSILILKYVPFSVILIGVFLPTIIHVYLFTLLFMIYGTLKNSSKAGIVSIVFLILCPFIILVSNIVPTTYILSETVQTTFIASGFQALNGSTAKFLSLFENGNYFLLSKVGIKIQIFLAFCYTYHYLNWFSKTSIIGWNKSISKPKLFAIIIIWLISILLYWYDYKTGVTALFFLSFLHVVLEFPLNIISIKGILVKFNNRIYSKQN